MLDTCVYKLLITQYYEKLTITRNKKAINLQYVSYIYMYIYITPKEIK